jgi:hypothetical protein
MKTMKKKPTQTSSKTNKRSQRNRGAKLSEKERMEWLITDGEAKSFRIKALEKANDGLANLAQEHRVAFNDLLAQRDDLTVLVKDLQQQVAASQPTAELERLRMSLAALSIGSDMQQQAMLEIKTFLKK